MDTVLVLSTIILNNIVKILDYNHVDDDDDVCCVSKKLNFSDIFNLRSLLSSPHNGIMLFELLM